MCDETSNSSTFNKHSNIHRKEQLHPATAPAPTGQDKKF